MLGRVHKQKSIILVAIFIASGYLIQTLNTVSPPDKIKDTLTLTLGILYESIPFVILGVLLSVLIQKYISNDVFYRYLPKRGWLKRPVLSLFGMFLPVCECGNIPLARGFMKKGLKPGEGEKVKAAIRAGCISIKKLSPP